MSELAMKLITVFLCVSIISFASCTAHTDYRMAKAIKGGADPIKVKCAFSVNASTPTCAIASINKEVK